MDYNLRFRKISDMKDMVATLFRKPEVDFEKKHTRNGKVYKIVYIA